MTTDKLTFLHYVTDYRLIPDGSLCIYPSDFRVRDFRESTRQMTRATFTAKMAAIAHAIPRHTFGGIQALFFDQLCHRRQSFKLLLDF
jgi:hypothetical protein